MKIFLAAILVAFQVYAAPKISLKTECYKIKDKLDRSYCQDKKSQLLRKRYGAQRSRWKRGLAAKKKKQENAKLNQEIAAKQEQLKLLELELKLLQDNQKSLAKAKVKKKKEKKDNSLQGQLERALKIKL